MTDMEMLNAEFAAMLDLHKAARYKPGERRTRRDGSVWEGQRGGPPVRVEGPKRAADSWKRARTEPETHWARERWREARYHREKIQEHTDRVKHFASFLNEIEPMRDASDIKGSRGVQAVRDALTAHRHALRTHRTALKHVGTDAHDWIGAQGASHAALLAERARPINWAEGLQIKARRAAEDGAS